MASSQPLRVVVELTRLVSPPVASFSYNNTPVAAENWPEWSHSWRRFVAIDAAFACLFLI